MLWTKQIKKLDRFLHKNRNTIRVLTVNEDNKENAVSFNSKY